MLSNTPKGPRVPAMPPGPHLPAAHLRPPRNWINDPNGLVFHDGYYHVFYQYNPHGAEHADMHWGHFRSRDLLTWEPLPIALTPTPGGQDADGCFSGNAVSDGDRLTAYYSAYRRERWSQPVTTAESRDGGLTFRPRGDLLIPQPPEDCTMYRDPYVWREGERWRMLVGAALADGRAAVLRYESPDGEEWTYHGPFNALPPQPIAGTGYTTGEGWECPQYLPLGGGRGLLIVSSWNSSGDPGCVIAHAGREHDGAFHADTGTTVLFDHGPDFYAPALLRAPGERWLLWGWSWEACEPSWPIERGWAGVLTVPREITLTEHNRPSQQPAAELLDLRAEHVIHARGRLETGQSGELGTLPRSFDLTAHLDTQGEAGLRLVTSADGSEYLDIRHDRASGQLVVDRDHASLDPRARGGSYRLPCPADKPLDLRILIDHSIAELFTSTGQTLTVRFYPVGEGPWHLQAHAAPDARLQYTVDAWNLRPLTFKEPSADTDVTQTPHSQRTPA